MAAIERPRLPRTALHLLGLWALAVAHPLLDLLQRSPEFFVAHDASPADITIIVLGVVLLVPLALTAVVWIGGYYALRSAIAVLVGALAIQLVKQAGIQTSPIAIPLGAAAGIAAAVAYRRVHAAGIVAALSAVALIVVPVLFLTRPGIRPLIRPPRAPRGPEATSRPGAAPPGPLLMLVVDETSAVSLMDAEEKIDPVLYPNFARLARDGIWFRNATAVSDYTRWAVPPIVSGKYPRPELLPTSADHPDSLFTALARTHRMEVVEAVTHLCPRELCREPVDPLMTRVDEIGRDLAIVYLHLLLPDDLRKRLPSLTSGWARFGSAPGEEQSARPETGPRPNNHQIALTFAEWIAPQDPQPTFYFFHTLLTHSPWEWLPSGQRNATRTPLPGDKSWSWTDDEWGVTQYYQRHLLQVGLLDAVVGRLIARLEAAGLYERTLVVVTADHGVAFQTNTPRRGVTPQGEAEVMRVPLLIKPPAGVRLPPAADVGGQHISDRNAETIDIAPTVADILGLELPWTTDGVSLFDVSRAERESKTIIFESGKRSKTYNRDGPAAGPPLLRKLAIFGGSDNFYRIPRPPRFGELVGRQLNELRVEDGGGDVSVANIEKFEKFDGRSDTVAFDVAGEIQQPRSGNAPTFLAVAVNGTVRAVTRTWDSEPRKWQATPPLDAWREGRNEVQIFVVDADAAGPLLRRTRRPTS